MATREERPLRRRVDDLEKRVRKLEEPATPSPYWPPNVVVTPVPVIVQPAALPAPAPVITWGLTVRGPFVT